MTGSSPISSVLEGLSRDPSWKNVTARQTVPPREGSYGELPRELHGGLRKTLARRGINRLYSHQLRAWELIRQERDVVVATPTASGKSLAFHLPVLDTMAGDPSATALYIYPTKALARDQLEDLSSLWGPGKMPGGVYDGDTPVSARRRLRSGARLLVSNPDMLHRALLPHHPSWSRFFSGLKYVVVDEVHQYRGIFGSHAANVFRRLNRICRFWGSEPRFIASSATIANPVELTDSLTGRRASLVEANGAPSCRKDFLFYNPPLVDRDRGIRAGNWMETVRLTAPFLAAGHKAIVFARSRRETEIILTYLKEALKKEGLPESWVRGYRGGYLPAERREIEKGLREGGIRAVVSTTALELGIDIGDLDVAVMSGYPGSVAGAWQQAGRAGRRSGDAAAFLVAENSPLDQFIVTHPEYFFGQPTESAALNPDNPHVLASHLACACFELPLKKGEPFGEGESDALLSDLERRERIHLSGDSWHWVGQTYPAAEVSLRSAAAEAFVIRDAASGEEIGMVDAAGAPLLVHREAVYLHGGETFIVEEFDPVERKVLVRAAEVDYFTEPLLKIELERFGQEEVVRWGEVTLGHGEVDIVTAVTGYRRLRLFTHEQLGEEELDFPESRMSTTSCRLTVSRDGAAGLEIPVLQGAGYLLSRVAPLIVLCDPRDIRSYHQGSGDSREAALHLYDHYPGGAGCSPRIFEDFPRLVSAAHEVARACPCRRGCPSCLGPEMAVMAGGKEAAGEFLFWLRAQFGERPA